MCVNVKEELQTVLQRNGRKINKIFTGQAKTEGRKTRQAKVCLPLLSMTSHSKLVLLGEFKDTSLRRTENFT